MLPLARLLDALANLRRWFTHSVARQFFVIDPRHLNMNVDAVEERTAEAILVAHHLRERVGAFFGQVSPITTRAGVHTDANFPSNVC